MDDGEDAKFNIEKIVSQAYMNPQRFDLAPYQAILARMPQKPAAYLGFATAAQCFEYLEYNIAENILRASYTSASEIYSDCHKQQASGQWISEFKRAAWHGPFFDGSNHTKGLGFLGTANESKFLIDLNLDDGIVVLFYLNERTKQGASLIF